MKKLRPARIEIELEGVRAVLEGCSHDVSDGDFWICEDKKIKKLLDLKTRICILDDVIPYPPIPLEGDWPIEAGRVVAQELGAKIIREEPMVPGDPIPYDPNLLC